MNDYALGFELLIIGMGTVFLSLYLMSVFLYFSGKFFGPEAKTTNKKEKKTEKNKVDFVKSADKSREDKNDNSDLSAKKMAAVSAAVYEMLNDKNNYRIISIQKRNNNWKR